MCVCLFYRQVFEWADVYVPSDKETKYCFYNEHRDAVDIFESDGIIEIDSFDNIANRLIKTVKIKTYLNILRHYLLQEIPFTIIGPSGSGTRCAYINLLHANSLLKLFFFVFFLFLFLLLSMVAHQFISE